MTEATKEKKNNGVRNINDLGKLPVMIPKSWYGSHWARC